MLHHFLSIIIYIVWFIFSSGNEEIRFLDLSFNRLTWTKIQANLDNLLLHGEYVSVWEDSIYTPHFYRPCVWEDDMVYRKWIWGICYDSEYVRGNIWKWVPLDRRKRIKDWSQNRMCRIMNGRNIAFAGDSMSIQMLFTFVSAMQRDILIPNKFINDKSI